MDAGAGGWPVGLCVLRQPAHDERPGAGGLSGGAGGGQGHADPDRRADRYAAADDHACAAAPGGVCARHQRRHAAARQPGSQRVSADHPEQGDRGLPVPEPVCLGRHDVVSGAVCRPVGLHPRRPRAPDGRAGDGGLPGPAGGRARHADPDAPEHAGADWPGFHQRVRQADQGQGEPAPHAVRVRHLAGPRPDQYAAAGAGQRV